MREKTEFNFALRWRQSDPEAFKKEKLKRQWTWGITGTVCLFMIVSSPWLWQYLLQAQLNQTNRAIGTLAATNALWQKSNQLKTELDNQKQVEVLARSASRDPLPLWEKILGLLPPGTSVDTFALTGDSLNLKVTLPTPVDVAQLWTRLQDSHLFMAVDIQALSLQNKPQSLSLNLKLNGSLSRSLLAGGK